ncbi:MAG TPA: pirin family protein [Phycisphaerales bacterium]|nr:pirin family protein [Phycisphaerales bacterium]
MITIRKAHDRGRTEAGWLHAWHTFSFGEYHDPRHTRFRTLRVINDDTVEPGQGFGRHPHRDMEIITVVLEGALEHKDSLGHGEVLRPGEVQVMSAGSGIEHSEFNPSTRERTHLLQTWIFPEQKGIPPAYGQKAFPREQRLNTFRRVAGRDKVDGDGALKINQDADVLLAALTPGGSTERALGPGRGAWVHVATGEATVNGHALKAGDAAALVDEPQISVSSKEGGDLLVFDLA